MFACEIKKQNWGSKAGLVHADKEEGGASAGALFCFANQVGKANKLVTVT